MKRKFFISATSMILFLFSLTMAGCGGGGGGDSGGGPAPLTYSGLTSQASISATNAEDIAADALLGGTVGVSVLGSTDADEITRPIISHLYVIELPKILRQSTEDVNWQSGNEIAPLRVESDTISGECGGNLSYTVNVDDTTGYFTGTFNYSQYCDSGITISGTVRVDGNVDLATNEFEIINFNFDRLTSEDFIISGVIALNDTNADSSVVTMDFYFEDIAFDKVYWIHDYSLTITAVNAADTQLSITGVFYDPDYGFVNVSTPDPFTIISTDEWPTTGTMLCEGSGNTKAVLSAVDSVSYRIEADTNGDNVYDYDSGVLLWSNL